MLYSLKVWPISKRLLAKTSCCWFAGEVKAMMNGRRHLTGKCKDGEVTAISCRGIICLATDNNCGLLVQHS